jgi:hypothetical protein
MIASRLLRMLGSVALGDEVPVVVLVVELVPVVPEADDDALGEGDTEALAEGDGEDVSDGEGEAVSVGDGETVSLGVGSGEV